MLKLITTVAKPLLLNMPKTWLLKLAAGIAVILGIIEFYFYHIHHFS